MHSFKHITISICECKKKSLTSAANAAASCDNVQDSANRLAVTMGLGPSLVIEVWEYRIKGLGSHTPATTRSLKANCNKPPDESSVGQNKF